MPKQDRRVYLFVNQDLKYPVNWSIYVLEINCLKHCVMWESSFPSEESWLKIMHPTMEQSYLLLIFSTFAITLLVVTIAVSLFYKSVMQKLTKASLREAESKYRYLLERSQVGVYILKGDRLVYVNPKFAEIFGYEKKDMAYMDVSQLISKQDWKRAKVSITQLLRGKVENAYFNYKGIRKDGKKIYLDIQGSSVVPSKSVIGTIIDMTEQREGQEKVKKLAYYDPLTELPNRFSLQKKLDGLIEQSKGKRLTFGLFFIDLDRFKMVNDSMGNKVGDQLLIQSAKRLTKNKCYDTFRQNGDEFAILVSDIPCEKARVIAEDLIALFSEPFMLGGAEIYTSISIGICMYPADGITKEQLMKNADTAVHYVKSMGKNHYQFYDESFKQDIYNQLALETDLRKALDQNEFELHYQPQICLKTGKITGTEALIRWNHAQKGMIPPAAFIPFAEDTGLIIPIGEWVLRAACRQNKIWRDMGYHLSVSVNLSPKQLFQKGFIEKISDVLQETELEPQYLELEITETVTMDMTRMIKLLYQLKGLGVKISVDDFGTGYSSLNYLKELPIDKLKIDQSFIRDSDSDVNDSAIVKTIIGMAHNLNLQVIAEGVEKLSHLSFLKGHQCHGAQGYLFSKPLSAEKLVAGMEDLQNKVSGYVN